MTSALRNYISNFVIVYIGHIIIYSHSIEQYTEHRLIFKKLEEHATRSPHPM